MAQPQALPQIFCVQVQLGNRNGYALYRAVPEGGNYRLYRHYHANVRYNIVEDANRRTLFQTVSVIKQQGTARRVVNWRKTAKYLSRGNVEYPIVNIPISALTAHNESNWIPILDNAAPANVPTPAPAPAPVPQQAQQGRLIPITKIPAHALRALLEHALIHEHLCPIMDVEIDVSNGAVTSCFHIFEKSAIKKWLETPNSQQKCPVCNQPCNSYCLDDETRAPSPLPELLDN